MRKTKKTDYKLGCVLDENTVPEMSRAIISVSLKRHGLDHRTWKNRMGFVPLVRVGSKKNEFVIDLSRFANAISLARIYRAKVSSMTDEELTVLQTLLSCYMHQIP